jgi:hypothetical protein
LCIDGGEDASSIRARESNVASCSSQQKLQQSTTARFTAGDWIDLLLEAQVIDIVRDF